MPETNAHTEAPGGPQGPFLPFQVQTFALRSCSGRR